MVPSLHPNQNLGSRDDLSILAVASPCKSPPQRLVLLLLLTRSDIKTQRNPIHYNLRLGLKDTMKVCLSKGKSRVYFI